MPERGIFVCPLCKTKLEEGDNGLKCLNDDRTFPILEGIPDFLPKEMSSDRRSLIGFVDKLSSIYETPIWYPVVYHFYGGLSIPSVKKTVDIITDMLEIDGGLALDAACGTGLFARSIARRAKWVYGFDVSMGMLRQARKYATRERLENITFARAEVEKIPFPNEFFDGISCCGALHLFPDTVEALREINRVLKRGSKLAVMTFARRRFLGIKRIYEHLEKDHRFHVFDTIELQRNLDDSGYEAFEYDIYGSMLLFEAKKI